MRSAAVSKGAPADYVMAALLSVCGSLIGNTRWPSPWAGWAEPPVVWSVIIGNPSAGKSPAMDAVLVPLKRVERAMREAAQFELAEWRGKAEVAKLAESAWKEAVKAAIKSGDEPPARPSSANPGAEPPMPRLAVSDATVEKLAVIMAGQPRGTLMARDELAGWLGNMSRYSGGSDRPFWLESYGGRSFSVERMGRDPVYIDRLTIGVLGGIQPDRLRSLLMKSDDDGLLARFLPVWPHPAPVKRPDALHDEAFIDNALRRLLLLEMPVDDEGHKRPWFIPFEDDARDLLDMFRQFVREWEIGAEGLLLSFVGKLPGLAVRLSLVLAMMEWATGEFDEPHTVTAHHFGRASHLVAEYLLPMARRAYAEHAGGQSQRAGRALAALIREEGWQRFTARDVRRKQRTHLQDMQAINPALKILETADLVKLIEVPSGPKGGAPKRLYSVNPLVHEVDQ
ncbi:YfjI family protein [Salipiger sp. 1_MG-2023]|uniref:YfjI family protein n=1 Tax=Salipiger sp. 1_MG-2023 TaxID=3062665 RepID=UPI0026E39A3C|nr:YfjI family protein [Salipiger sp. 1_MG-2023]MDO6584815.1 YfjI family protein [Salipiger sp. 1_MG-2023]